MPSDYTLWKMWWMATMYGASPQTRMAILDRYRNKQFPTFQNLFS